MGRSAPRCLRRAVVGVNAGWWWWMEDIDSVDLQMFEVGSAGDGKRGVVRFVIRQTHDSDTQHLDSGTER